MSTTAKGNTALRRTRLVRAALPLTAILGGILLCVSHTAASQSAGVNQGGSDYIHAPAGMTPMPQRNGAEAGSKVDQMRRAERHNRLAQDTAKLVELSNQLKAEVDRTPEDQISVGVTKKAADIEKLARDVRQWQTY